MRYVPAFRRWGPRGRGPKGGGPNLEKVGGPKGEGPEGWGARRVGGPKFRAFFLHLPLPFSLLREKKDTRRPKREREKERKWRREREQSARFWAVWRRRVRGRGPADWGPADRGPAEGGPAVAFRRFFQSGPPPVIFFQVRTLLW